MRDEWAVAFEKQGHQLKKVADELETTKNKLEGTEAKFDEAKQSMTATLAQKDAQIQEKTSLCDDDVLDNEKKAALEEQEAEYERRISELSTKPKATEKSNSQIAADVEKSFASDVQQLNESMGDVKASEFAMKRMLAMPTDAAKKVAWVEQQESICNKDKDYYEFIGEFCRRLLTSEFNKDGIERVRTWYANDKYRSKNLPSPPGAPRYTEEEALQIYEEGKAIGFYEHEIMDDLKAVRVYADKVKAPDDFKERTQFLTDKQHKKSPHQRGMKAAKLVIGAFWARWFPEMDVRVLKSVSIDVHTRLVSEKVRPSAFWSAFHRVGEEISLVGGKKKKKEKEG